MKRTIYVYTTGCSINQALGEILKGQLKKLSYELTDNFDSADIVILNLCAIKKPTEDKAIELISKLTKQGKRIIVTGCLAEANPKRIRKVSDKASVLSLDLLLNKPQEILDNIFNAGQIMDVGHPLKLSYPQERIQNNRLIGIVPIAFGCINNCSYCIDKLIWGNVKSIPPEQIVKEIRKLLEHGAKEIRLTALDTAAYGIDLNTDLVELLERILDLDYEFRLRIGMASPNTYARIMDRLLDVIKNDHRIYKFIHIPVQSGSNRILRLMRRPYTVEEYKEIFLKTRNTLGNDSTIATDIISAFPTETEEDHQATIRLLKELKPDIVNLSRYGDRPGRPSSRLKPKVHSKIAKRRTKELFEVIQQISYERNSQFIGRSLETLILESDGRYKGRAFNNRIVFVDSKGIEIGEFYVVKIKFVTWKSLYGEIESS